MDKKKHILNLESFSDMLHICPRVLGQSFVEPPFEEEILAFICFLGHSAVIMKLTDVNINKLYQPWRSFAAIINKFATGSAPPKPKASVLKTRSSFDITITPSTAGILLKMKVMMKERMVMVMKRMKEVVRGDEKDDEKEGGDDEQEYDEDEYDEETRDEKSFDLIPKTPKNSDDEGNGMESIFETTSQMDAQTPTSVAPLLMTAPTMTPSTIATITTTSQAPTPPTTALSTLIQDLPNFGSLFGFDNRLRTLEANLSEFMQTNQFTGTIFAIPRIVQRYMDQRMNEAVKVAVQIQSDCLHDETQKENDEFLKTIDENMQNIIKEQVKEQVQKMEGNKSIQRSDEQRNLYKALVEAYESDKIILDTYGETVTLKRRRDDEAGKDKEPFVGPDRESKRRKEGNEPESASAPTETAARSAEDLVPRTMWIQEPIGYDKHALWGVSHWGRKRQQFYSFAVNRESDRDVYSKQRIIAVTELKINKDKKNRLIRIDELHKFSDGTLIDVRTALDDHLKGIRMQYLPQSIWRKSDKDKAAAMIQAIDKRLKTKRIMRNLE
nr:hypothetical protein [Tanacetum cinerariifolium]